MTPRDQRALEFLRELGARPAVPFFEHGPAGYILAALEGMGVQHRRDEYGNIIAHYRRGPTGTAPIALVAHMDHPGFEVVEASGDRIVARALGGVPVASLRKAVPVLVLAPDGQRVPAETSPLPEPPPEQRSERLVGLCLKAPASLAPATPVVFDLPDFVLDGDFIRMRALDDLAGCASTLAVLERLAAESAEADVYGVFTRAEEAGLFGARLLAEARVLPPETLVVSRESLRQRDPGFKCQRQLMSGGTCEATAFAVFGYSVTGVAFPLGNYHNATTSIPDPNGGVGAEYIRLSDFLGGIELLSEAARSVARRGDSPVRRRLREFPEDVRRRLRDTRV